MYTETFTNEASLFQIVQINMFSVTITDLFTEAHRLLLTALHTA